MDIKEKIKNWLVKGGAFTPDDKKEIKAAATEAHLDIKFKSKCPNCYSDAVIMLAMHHGVNATVQGVETKSGNYLFTVPGKAIWFDKGVMRTLNATTDDETIERYMAQFPNQKFFIKNEKGGAE